MSMQFEKFNVSRPREEAQKDGTTKTFWDNVGTVTIFTKDDGSRSGILELNSFEKPTLKLNLFQRKQAQINNYSQPAPKDDYSQPEPEDDIRVENIPF